MESIWTNNTGKKDFEMLSRNQKTNTVVIGGGMAGVLTAYYLQQVGVPVIVLEAVSYTHLTLPTTSRV